MLTNHHLYSWVIGDWSNKNNSKIFSFDVHSNMKRTMFKLCSGSVNMKPYFSMTFLLRIHLQYFEHFILTFSRLNRKRLCNAFENEYMDSFWGQLGIWRWQIQGPWRCFGKSSQWIFPTLKFSTEAGNYSNTMLLLLNNFSSSI